MFNELNKTMLKEAKEGMTTMSPKTITKEIEIIITTFLKEPNGYCELEKYNNRTQKFTRGSQ